MHRLDQINALKPANQLDFRSLTLRATGKQIGRFKTVSRQLDVELTASGWRVRTKPQTADAPRDITWQGNCHVAEQYLCSNTACSKSPSSRITIPIEYPISNCPAKFGAASFLRLDPKRPGPQLVLLPGACRPGRFRQRSNAIHQ